MAFAVLAATVVLVIGSLGGLTTWASAQEPISRDERELGGHRFIPSGRLPDPFVSTHARFRTAGGIATGFRALYQISGEPPTDFTEADIGFFGLDFEYQQNLWERASVRLSLEGNARLGVDEQAMFSTGLSSTYGMELDGKYRLLRQSNLVLTLQAILSRKNLFGLSPLQFAEGIIEDGYDEGDKLVTEGQLSRVILGPSAAWAPKTWLGFVGFAFLGPADPFDDDVDTDTAFRGGLTGEVDFGAMGWWPIGLVGGFDYDSFPEVDNRFAEGLYAITFQTAYTGRPDFSIGLEITYSRIEQSDLTDEFGSTLIALNSRYYF